MLAVVLGVFYFVSKVTSSLVEFVNLYLQEEVQPHRIQVILASPL